MDPEYTVSRDSDTRAYVVRDSENGEWLMRTGCALLIVLSLLLSTIALGCSTNTKSATTLGTSQAETGVTGDRSQAKSFMGQPAGQRRREQMAQWVKRQLTFETPEATKNDLAFKLMYPRTKNLPALSGVYVIPKSVKEDRKAVVLFGDVVDGISLRARTLKKPNYSNESDMMNGGPAKFVLFTVHNLPAMGYESFTLDSPDGPVRTPSLVTWWEDGVSYQVKGSAGSDPTTLKELRNIAESVE